MSETQLYTTHELTPCTGQTRCHQSPTSTFTETYAQWIPSISESLSNVLAKTSLRFLGPPSRSYVLTVTRSSVRVSLVKQPNAISLFDQRMSTPSKCVDISTHEEPPIPHLADALESLPHQHASQRTPQAKSKPFAQYLSAIVLERA